MHAAMHRDLQPGGAVRRALAANDPFGILNAIDEPSLAHRHIQRMLERGDRRSARTSATHPLPVAPAIDSIEAEVAWSGAETSGRQIPTPLLP